MKTRPSDSVGVKEVVQLNALSREPERDTSAAAGVDSRAADDAELSPAVPPAASSAIRKPKRSSGLSKLVRDLRGARGEPGRPGVGAGAVDIEESPGREGVRADPERFDLARLSQKHRVPAHLVGRWARRPAGAKLVGELESYERERARLLLAAASAHAVRVLLALAGGGGEEDGPGATSAETRRKACVDLLKIGLAIEPTGGGIRGPRAGAGASADAERGSELAVRRDAEQAEETEFAERARAMLEDLGDESLGDGEDGERDEHAVDERE